MNMFSELKEKIFSHGIFGVQCARLYIHEILALLYEPWTEFVDEQQIHELESSFTTVALESKQAVIINHFEMVNPGFRDENSIISQDGPNKSYINDLNTVDLSTKYPRLNSYLLKNFTYINQRILRQLTSNLIVRMNTVAWKEYLTNNSFNFTSKEYYFVFDMLIRINNSISISEMRAALNIEPKKMFYIIKKINSLGYIDRIETDGKIFIRIRRDSNGLVIKGKEKLKKRSINSEDNIVLSEEKIDTKIGSYFLLGVPLIIQIKKLIDKSKNGISSKDIEEKFGIKLKIGLKLLNKIADKYKESIKTVEEFEGKIKRTKFYNINELNKRKEKKRLKIEKGEKDLNIEGITYEDRVQVIRQFLSKKPAFLLDKEIYQKFQTALGVKHTFDRRTIINAAIKGGFKVYKLSHGYLGAKIVIARNDIPEDHPCVKVLDHTKKIEKKLTSFQKNLYKFFVLPAKCIEMDNLYQINQPFRLNVLLNFINGIQADEFFFDCEILEEMSIYTFFQLVSFKKVQFIIQLLEALKRTNPAMNPRENMSEFNTLEMSSGFTPSLFFDPKHAMDITDTQVNDKYDLQQDIAIESKNEKGYIANRDVFHFDDENYPVSKKDYLSNQNHFLPKDDLSSTNNYFNFNPTCTQTNINLHSNIVDLNLLILLAIPFDQKTINILESPMKIVFDSELPSEVLKFMRIKFEVKPFLVHLKELEKHGKIRLDLRSNRIKVTKMVDMNIPIQNNEHSPFMNYMPIPEREAFFSKICDIPEHRFIKECLFVINRDYDPQRIQILTARLNAFKKHMPWSNDKRQESAPFLPMSLQNMYIDLKKKILLNEKICLNQYKYQDIEIIMKYMTQKKIVSKFSSDLKNIELTAAFTRKFNMKFNEILYTPIQPDSYFSPMHEYYLKYFDLIYYTIMRHGSYEINKLSEDIEILETFELDDLFSNFQSHFIAEEADDKIFISIVENDNLLLKFPDE